MLGKTILFLESHQATLYHTRKHILKYLAVMEHKRTNIVVKPIHRKERTRVKSINARLNLATANNHQRSF